MHENIYVHLLFYIYFFTFTHLLKIYYEKLRKQLRFLRIDVF